MKNKKHKAAFEVAQDMQIVAEFRIVGNGNCWTIERHNGEKYLPCHKNGDFCDFHKFEIPFVYRNINIAKDNLKKIEATI